MSEIAQALIRMFDRHRIVFWFDTKCELRAEFDDLALDDVEKIVLENNQFAVKYRVLHQQPDQKFLLYHEGPPPDDLDNWLLDLQLACGEFRADQTALWLTEMGLGLEFTDVVAPHAEFFKAARRRQSLKCLLEPDDTPQGIRVKMLAVCAGAEPRLDSIGENLLAELAVGKEERFSLVQRCAPDGFLWEQSQRVLVLKPRIGRVSSVRYTWSTYGHLRENGNMTQDLSTWIHRDPQICGGQPVVRGTRVLVRTILASLAEGVWVDDILADFPTLTEEQVRAVIEFAAASAQEDLPIPASPAFP